MAFIVASGDTYDPTAMVSIKRISFMQKLLLRLSIPFYLPKLFMQCLLNRVVKNPLHDGKRELSGIKLASSSQDFFIRDVKAAAKHKKVTINDMIAACLSTSVKTYFERKGDNKTKEINIVIPANIRFKPYARYQDVKLENKFAVVPLRIPLTNDINEALNLIPTITSKIKSAIGEVYAAYFFTKLSLVFLPYCFTNMYMDFCIKPFTLAFSNTPGLFKPISIFGKKH